LANTDGESSGLWLFVAQKAPDVTSFTRFGETVDRSVPVAELRYAVLDPKFGSPGNLGSRIVNVSGRRWYLLKL
jgi:hypothetical protein